MELKVYKLGADWCSACKTLTETLKDRKGQYTEIDVTQDTELASMYGIRNIPATLFIKDGVLINKKLGAYSVDEFDSMVKQALDA